MFVLSNAWRALTRSKGRTVLTALITLVVTFGTVAGLAIVQENHTAHTDDYDVQKATLAVRPSAASWKKVSPTDSASTKHYMTWTDYTEYATIIQQAGVTLDFTVTETVPARVSGDLKAVSGDSLGSASDDKTGGQLIWRAFWTKDAASASDLGTFKIVSGKNLSYDNQSSDPDTTSALVSSAFAKANNLKVGDKFKVATASDASTTYELTVRGIYEYTAGSTADNPVVTARNRENAIFTNYQTFAEAGLDPQTGDSSVSGWKVPDLNVVFNASDAAGYKKLVNTFKKSKLPASGYTVSSPSLEAYNKSLEPLDAVAGNVKTGTIVLLAVGGVLLLALVLVGVWGPKRDDEIGMALVSGVSRGRLGWQLMLEVFFTTLPFYVIGLVAGVFSTKPLAAAIASGHEVTASSSLIWQMVWGGLGTIVVLAILAALRLAFYRADKLFAADGDWGSVSETETIESESNHDDAEAQA
ncbi:ABC transporter permease [Bifidobacterium cebidarum]|uniref:Peptide ABC transporter permease n=1 Tax=Bifidobacterium cebidarum TaxID=2650773 RepID=A0A6I1G7R1_9BIFI|nr:ABC transporter permease [Bifidobacterium cebidarum]KAB7786808.1 peptide ABC transporter permease [Bifidobacterium cebidarum]